MAKLLRGGGWFWTALRLYVYSSLDLENWPKRKTKQYNFINVINFICPFSLAAAVAITVWQWQWLHTAAVAAAYDEVTEESIRSRKKISEISCIQSILFIVRLNWCPSVCLTVYLDAFSLSNHINIIFIRIKQKTNEIQTNRTETTNVKHASR